MSLRGCRVRAWIGLGAGLLLAGCRSGPGPAPALGGADPGIHERVIPGPDGRELRFTVAVPAQYDGMRPVPLVLALHFGGSAFPPFFGRGILELLMLPALEPLGAIIVAPDAVDPGWNDEVDEKRVLFLLDHLLASFAIDRKRVLCTGYSMGGAGTWYLVGRHAERFTAAIPIAGRPPDATAPGKWTVPVHAIHSRKDELVPLAPVEAYVANLKGQGANVQLTIVDELTHFQTDRFVEPLRDRLGWLGDAWK
jgi:predicted peptidase